MELNDNVLQMWNLMGLFMVSNAMFFAACAFLIWVGFRFSNNIYNTPDTPILGKAMATLFCLSVAMFTFGNMSALNQLFKDVAAVFAAMQEQGVVVGAPAENLIAETTGAPANSIVQIAFLGSVVIMQMAQIWMKKN